MGWQTIACSWPLVFVLFYFYMLLHVSVVHSFLLLSNILLYGYTTFVYPFTCFGPLCCFQLLVIINKITLNKSLYGHLLSFLLGKYQGSYGRYIFSLLEIVKLFSKVVVLFCIPISNAGEFQLLHILASIWCRHAF